MHDTWWPAVRFVARVPLSGRCRWGGGVVHQPIDPPQAEQHPEPSKPYQAPPTCAWQCCPAAAPRSGCRWPAPAVRPPHRAPAGPAGRRAACPAPQGPAQQCPPSPHQTSPPSCLVVVVGWRYAGSCFKESARRQELSSSKPTGQRAAAKGICHCPLPLLSSLACAPTLLPAPPSVRAHASLPHSLAPPPATQALACSPARPRHDHILGVLGVGLHLYGLLATGCSHAEAPDAGGVVGAHLLFVRIEPHTLLASGWLVGGGEGPQM